MSTSQSTTAPSYDAITAEEITGEATGNVPQPGVDPSSPKRPNAFTELMSSSKKPKSVSPDSKGSKGSKETRSSSPKPLQDPKSMGSMGGPRDGLGIYIQQPEKNPEGRVIEYDDEFVVINDKFPKSSVHLLLLPRDPAIYYQHPLTYLSTHPSFLAEVRTRVERLKRLAARELRRQYGSHSALDAPYQSALNELMSSSDNPPSDPEERDALLPPGRDWLKEIVAGVHTHPSMNHMHIHILSREHSSPWMKHKKHYLSFNTSFLVGVDEFPLEEDSPRHQPGKWPEWDLVCWRCGANYRNKMAALSRHLEEETEEWKKE